MQTLETHTGRYPTHAKYPYTLLYLNIRGLFGYCGAKEFDNPDPLYTGPKTRAEEGEMAEDGQRKPKWPRSVTEDDPALNTPNPKGREQCIGKDSLPERPQEKGKYNRIPIGVWCRSNLRKNCHLRIECIQLTFWPH